MPRRRWVSALLKLYPRAFREMRGEEIEDFVAHEMATAGCARTRTAAALAWDLLRGAVRARIAAVSAGGSGGFADGSRDCRIALRGLSRSPGFSVVVVGTLALGIGLNASVFAAVHGVLVRPLPYPDADRLVYVAAHFDQGEVEDALVSGGDWRDLRDGVPALVDLEALAMIRQNLAGVGPPRQVVVGWVSPGFLGMLGASPERGRLFRADDPPGTVVLSHATWTEMFGADPGAVGRSVRLDGQLYSVVGVLPASFHVELPTRGDVPLSIDVWKNPDTLWQNGDIWGEQWAGNGFLRMVGRLRPGETRPHAQSQADAVATRIRAEFSRYDELGLRFVVDGLHARVVRTARSSLLLLMGAVLCVLFIACANVAHLLLVRAEGRRRELAVRVALGAPAHQLTRLLLLESLLLALAGSVVGLAFAFGTVRGLGYLTPPMLPRAGDIRVDGTVLAFCLAAAVATALGASLVPGLRALRTDPAQTLGGARGGGGRRHRARGALVMGQVSVSLVLLVGAGLLMSSLIRLRQVDLGFNPDGLYTFGIAVPGTDYRWPEEAGRFYRQVEARVAALPGVEAAGIVWPVPVSHVWDGEVEVGSEGSETLGALPYYLATEAYFGAAGIPLLEGRLFRDGDARAMAVISEETARRAFPDRSALGGVVRANPWGGDMQDFEVIGVVGDVRTGSLRDAPVGGVYFDARSWSWVDWEVHVVARTHRSDAALLPDLRGALGALDPNVPVAHPRAMSELIADRTASARFGLGLLTAFAAAATGLALVGLYGVVSYTVALRRREIGIRMALGSGRGTVAAGVVAGALRMAGTGVLLGWAGAFLAGRALRSFLYGVGPTDPGVFTIVGAAMLLAAGVAAWIPARRAARAQPAEVLRSE